jgi:hypothetical protein
MAKRTKKTDDGIDLDSLMGPFIVAHRMAQVFGLEDEQRHVVEQFQQALHPQPELEPMPKSFSAADAFRARGMGIGLD